MKKIFGLSNHSEVLLMLIIGEKLNSSIPSVKPLMDSSDIAALTALIQKQAEAGADYLDINTALCSDEAGMMQTLVSLVLQHTSCGIMLDSPDPNVILETLPLCGDRPVIVNSVTPTDRFDTIVPALVNDFPTASLVAMPIGVESHEDMDKFIRKLTDAGLSPERIYMDLYIESVATDDTAGKRAIDTLKYLKQNHPRIKTTCGLSNIAFGLPSRQTVNSAFFALCASLGLDSAILDALSPSMTKTRAAIKLLSGEDEYCMDYITCIREFEN